MIEADVTFGETWTRIVPSNGRVMGSPTKLGAASPGAAPSGDSPGGVGDGYGDGATEPEVEIADGLEPGAGSGSTASPVPGMSITAASATANARCTELARSERDISTPFDWSLRPVVGLPLIEADWASSRENPIERAGNNGDARSAEMDYP